MRGARAVLILSCFRNGIIPAYAGSTSCVAKQTRMPEDHPRVCGEHAIAPGAGAETPGSSPRMRGAQGPAGPAATVDGIIPAYAGSTVDPAWHKARTRDHPRVCGEHARLASM